MKFECNLCNYKTNDRSNYYRHVNSKHHKENIDTGAKNELISDNEQNLKCDKCGKQFSYKSGLSRHKNYRCKKLEDENNELKEMLRKKDEEIKDKLRIKELETKVECLEKIINTPGTISNVNSNNTVNISVNTFVNKYYPDAPPLKPLDIYNITGNDDEDDKLIKDLIYHQRQKTLPQYLGNFLIKHYKKDDPSQQSLWNSDTTRLSYLVKELLKDDESRWHRDPNAIRLTSCTISPFLAYIKSKTSNYVTINQKFLEKNRFKSLDVNEIQKTVENMRTLTELNIVIDNGNLTTDIIKSITPHFYLDNNQMTKQIEKIKQQEPKNKVKQPKIEYYDINFIDDISDDVPINE